ncbi:hypothetical protein AVEN_118321-1 [Araneus ventricosus]|uniref:Histone-lysine N-methyltransferase SETMAR n=1 Tax=Araneus ventricosus TaxID=182803 RepID=A0A4Y2B6F3_ARAVE|nr:hypothetical protein AVEN_118321-1 [Araneus ventricosus]
MVCVGLKSSFPHNSLTIEDRKLGAHCIQTKDHSRISGAHLTPLFDHSPYSPNLAPSDFHLFLKLKEFMGNKRFGSDGELKNSVTTWLNELAAEEHGNSEARGQIDKCLNIGGDSVEK